MKYVIFLLIIAPALFAQVEWFGYYESEADFAALPNNNIFFNYNKLRLDIAAAPNAAVSIGADVAAKFFQGETQLNLMDYLHHSYHPILPDGSTLSEFPYALQDTLYLDNAFMRISTKYFDLTLGRQQISPGVGYVWNPIDIFNVKDITDPTYEQTGVDAIRVDIPLGPISFTGITSFENSVKETKQFYQLKTQIQRFDIAAIYARSPLFQYNASFAHHNQQREIFGISAEGELWGGIGFRSEVSFQQMNDKEKWSYILGCDYTFKNSLYMLGEFFHNELGNTFEKTTFTDYLNYLSGFRKSLNQNYVFAMALYPMGDLWDGGCSAIYNVDDRSIMLIPQIVFRAFQDVELTAMLQVAAGEQNTEFGAQGFGGLIRMRAYF